MTLFRDSITTKKDLKNKQNDQFENNENNKVTGEKLSLEEIIGNIDNLKFELAEYFKSKDNEEKYSDYSYAEMFELLEKYLEIIPNNSRFRDIMNYF